MTNKQTLIAGGLALVVGFVGGNVAGRNAGSGTDRLANNVKSLSAQNDGLSETVGALGAELTALQEQFGTLEAGMGEQIGALQSGMGDQLGALEAGMSDRIGALETGMGSQFEALAAQVTDMAGASSSGMSDLGTQLGDGLATIEAGQSEMMTAVTAVSDAAMAGASPSGEGTVAAVAAAAVAGAAAMGSDTSTAEAADGAVETATASDTAAPAAEDSATAEAAPAADDTTMASDDTDAAPMLEGGIGVGQTAIFADGALRVFASGINEDNAMLSINGMDRKRVSLGGRMSAMAGETTCLVMLDAIEESQIGLSSACGDDRPEPEGIEPGMTQLFGDTRVFYSGVAGEDMARIAINGIGTSVLGYGETIEVPGKNCSVRLEGMDRNFAAMSSDC